MNGGGKQMAGTKHEHFYGIESEQFTFYKVPKQLFVDEEFWNISAEAKLLYGILLDRMSLSAANNWRDEDGKVYIIFTIDDIKAYLGCAEKKAVKLLNELENKCGLIDRVRQGLGKPNIIYVRNFLPSGVDNSVERQLLNCQKDNYGTVKKTIQDLSKAQCNNTNINKTDNSYTDQSIYPENPKMTDEEMMSYEEYKSFIKEKLDYEYLAHDFKNHKAVLDELFEILVDTLRSTRKDIRIGRNDISSFVVKSRLSRITPEHIKYVMNCILENTSEISNIYQYMLTALYNSVSTIDSYYTTLVNYQFGGGY